MNLANQLSATIPPEPVALPGTLALLFGIVRPPARPACAPVRTHRMSYSAAKLPDLPHISSTAPAVVRCEAQRRAIYRHMLDAGRAETRDEIAVALGLTAAIVSDRLGELKRLGVVRLERSGRVALWEIVEVEDEEGEE